ncbi:MAG: hypothetical protein PHQ36_05810 [Anaerolineales bacterium]|nr:hypothetical protein [Anaerolineales bacterium]
MTDLILDSTRSLNVVFAETAVIRDFKEAEPLAVGDSVYINAAGKAGLTNSDGVAPAKAQGRGIVVKRQGSTVSVMKSGYLGGYDLSGLAYDAQLFLSATPGKLADAEGTISVPCGRVSCLTNESLTKVMYVNFDWITQFA